MADPAAASSALAQPFLFAPEIVAELTNAEAKGEYTAQRLRECHPDKYQAIITLRGWDWGQKRIAQLLHVHHRTVAAVDDAEAEPIDTLRRRLAKNLRRAASLQVDRLLDHPESVPMQFAAVVANTLIGSSELLDGRATARVEHVEKLRFDDWDAFVEKQLAPEDVTEIPAEPIGSMGEKKAPVMAGDQDPACLEAPAPNPLDVLRPDGESEGKGQLAQVNRADVTANATDPGADPGDRDPAAPGAPGGGADSLASAGGHSTHTVRRKISSDKDPF